MHSNPNYSFSGRCPFRHAPPCSELRQQTADRARRRLSLFNFYLIKGYSPRKYDKSQYGKKRNGAQLYLNLKMSGLIAFRT